MADSCDESASTNVFVISNVTKIGWHRYSTVCRTSDVHWTLANENDPPSSLPLKDPVLLAHVTLLSRGIPCVWSTGHVVKDTRKSECDRWEISGNISGLAHLVSPKQYFSKDLEQSVARKSPFRNDSRFQPNSTPAEIDPMAMAMDADEHKDDPISDVHCVCRELWIFQYGELTFVPEQVPELGSLRLLEEGYITHDLLQSMKSDSVFHPYSLFLKAQLNLFERWFAKANILRVGSGFVMMKCGTANGDWRFEMFKRSTFGFRSDRLLAFSINVYLAPSGLVFRPVISTSPLRPLAPEDVSSLQRNALQQVRDDGFDLGQGTRKRKYGEMINERDAVTDGPRMSRSPTDQNIDVILAPHGIAASLPINQEDMTRTTLRAQTNFHPILKHWIQLHGMSLDAAAMYSERPTSILPPVMLVDLYQCCLLGNTGEKNFGRKDVQYGQPCPVHGDLPIRAHYPTALIFRPAYANPESALSGESNPTPPITPFPNIDMTMQWTLQRSAREFRRWTWRDSVKREIYREYNHGGQRKRSELFEKLKAHVLNPTAGGTSLPGALSTPNLPQAVAAKPTAKKGRVRNLTGGAEMDAMSAGMFRSYSAGNLASAKAKSGQVVAEKRTSPFPEPPEIPEASKLWSEYLKNMRRGWKLDRSGTRNESDPWAKRMRMEEISGEESTAPRRDIESEPCDDDCDDQDNESTIDFWRFVDPQRTLMESTGGELGVHDAIIQERELRVSTWRDLNMKDEPSNTDAGGVPHRIRVSNAETFAIPRSEKLRKSREEFLKNLASKGYGPLAPTSANKDAKSIVVFPKISGPTPTAATSTLSVPPNQPISSQFNVSNRSGDIAQIDKSFDALYGSKSLMGEYTASIGPSHLRLRSSKAKHDMDDDMDDDLNNMMSMDESLFDFFDDKPTNSKQSADLPESIPENPQSNLSSAIQNPELDSVDKLDIEKLDAFSKVDQSIVGEAGLYPHQPTPGGPKTPGGLGAMSLTPSEIFTSPSFVSPQPFTPNVHGGISDRMAVNSNTESPRCQREDVGSQPPIPVHIEAYEVGGIDEDKAAAITENFRGVGYAALVKNIIKDGLGSETNLSNKLIAGRTRESGQTDSDDDDRGYSSESDVSDLFPPEVFCNLESNSLGLSHTELTNSKVAHRSTPVTRAPLITKDQATSFLSKWLVPPEWTALQLHVDFVIRNVIAGSAKSADHQPLPNKKYGNGGPWSYHPEQNSLSNQGDASDSDTSEGTDSEGENSSMSMSASNVPLTTNPPNFGGFDVLNSALLMLYAQVADVPLRLGRCANLLWGWSVRRDSEDGNLSNGKITRDSQSFDKQRVRNSNGQQKFGSLLRELFLADSIPTKLSTSVSIGSPSITQIHTKLLPNQESGLPDMPDAGSTWNPQPAMKPNPITHDFRLNLDKASVLQSRRNARTEKLRKTFLEAVPIYLEQVCGFGSEVFDFEDDGARWRLWSILENESTCMSLRHDSYFNKAGSGGIELDQSNIIQASSLKLVDLHSASFPMNSTLASYNDSTWTHYGPPLHPDSSLSAINLIQKVLSEQFGVEKGAGVKDGSEAASNVSSNLRGPLTIQQYFELEDAVRNVNTKYSAKFQLRKKRRGTDQPIFEPLNPPEILVGYNRNWLRANPAILRFWDKLRLEPFGGSKNVRWLALFPQVIPPAPSPADDVSWSSQGRRDSVGDLHALISRWMSIVGHVYEFCNFGEHRPAHGFTHGTARVRTPQGGSGLVPVPLAPPISGGAETDDGLRLRSYLISLENLAADIARWLSTHHSQFLAVYLFDPFPNRPRSALDLSFCFARMIEKVIDAIQTQAHRLDPSVTMPTPDEALSRVILQLVPIEAALHSEAFEGFQTHGVQTLCLGLYTRCRKLLQKADTSSSQSVPKALQSTTPGLRNRKLFLPPYILANSSAYIPAGLPRFSLNRDINASSLKLFESERVLHVAYVLFGRWCSVCWCDQAGELVETASFEVQQRFNHPQQYEAPRLRTAKRTMDEPELTDQGGRLVAFRTIWQKTLEITSSTSLFWRIVLGKLGSIARSELRDWDTVLSPMIELQAQLCENITEQDQSGSFDAVITPSKKINSVSITSFRRSSSMQIYEPKYQPPSSTKPDTSADDPPTSRPTFGAKTSSTGKDSIIEDYVTSHSFVLTNHRIPEVISGILSSQMSTFEDDDNQVVIPLCNGWIVDTPRQNVQSPDGKDHETGPSFVPSVGSVAYEVCLYWHHYNPSTDNSSSKFPTWHPLPPTKGGDSVGTPSTGTSTPVMRQHDSVGTPLSGLFSNSPIMGSSNSLPTSHSVEPHNASVLRDVIKQYYQLRYLARTPLRSVEEFRTPFAARSNGTWSGSWSAPYPIRAVSTPPLGPTVSFQHEFRAFPFMFSTVERARLALGAVPSLENLAF
ncbi:mediator complex subunit 13 C-terminal-domain-containing protein [Cladochytrium replicatum]|nr:mediator complex subunit 13 C-terminal-domain-containing protein [Cladochytrium replicatum]